MNPNNDDVLSSLATYTHAHTLFPIFSFKYFDNRMYTCTSSLRGRGACIEDRPHFAAVQMASPSWRLNLLLEHDSALLTRYDLTLANVSQKRASKRAGSDAVGCGGGIEGQMTLMELLGMERLQLQTRSDVETLRQEARAAQVRREWTPCPTHHWPNPAHSIVPLA
jgi:hypothetical protein